MAEDSQGGQKQSLNRREFLKLAFAGGFVAWRTLKQLERTFYDSVIFGLTNSLANDKATEAALAISEQAPDSENPNFREMETIITEGISMYTSRTDNRVHFERFTGFEGADYYAEVVRDASKTGAIPDNPLKVGNYVIQALPPEATVAFEESSALATGYEKLFVPGSGFNARFLTRHPEHQFAEGRYTTLSNERFLQMDKDGQKELLATKLYVESKVKEEGEAVSSSILLDYFLEKNSGNLPQSIFDVALFLKMAARTDLNTGTFTADNKNIWWYQKNIKDEFQGPSYNHTPKDESAINLIGKPYHSWNLVALLYYLPANVVRAGGIYRQLTNFSAQGLGKTRADLQTLSDLREIESYLLEFAQKQS